MADLIDRQELLKHKGNCYDEEGHLLYAVGTGTILLMPTIDAEPVRHGHWDDTKVAFYLKCSECGCCVRSFAGEVFLDYSQEWNYCPNCGARMDEEDVR